MSLLSRISGSRKDDVTVSRETIDRLRAGYRPSGTVTVPNAGPDEPDAGRRDIALDTAEDLEAVLVVLHVIKDESDEAREIVRTMTPRERALFSFYLREAERIVEEEDTFRTQADRVQAREGHPAF